MSQSFALILAYYKSNISSQQRTTYHLCDLCLVEILGHLNLFPFEAALFVELDVVFLTVKNDFVAAIDLS